MFLPPPQSASSKKNGNAPAPPRASVRQGLHYKHFEHVVASLLDAGLEPHFVELPSPPCNSAVDAAAIADVLQQCAPLQCTTPKQMRKQQQLQSMMQCILSMLPDTTSTSATICDFAGGTGHLSIPLAILLPHCSVIVVDLKVESLQLVHNKAYNMMGSSRTAKDAAPAFVYPSGRTKQRQPSQHDHTKRPCAGIPNLYTFHGSIESFTEPFDVGVALHACGEASDLVLRACLARAASAVVAAPCCVGKLSRSVRNPYIFQATGANLPTVSYPQSAGFRRILPGDEDGRRQDWNALAKAADYSENLRLARNATRRVAKALVEHDRCLLLQQAEGGRDSGYQTALTRMEPWEASPKNDILLGWKSTEWSPFKASDGSPHSNRAANADFRLARDYLLQTSDLMSPTTGEEVATTTTTGRHDSAEWTVAEMRSIRETLQKFLNDAPSTSSLPPPRCSTYTFPTRMGRRQRKLIHHVAEQMGLRHWGHGKLDGDKTVVVGRRNDEKTSAAGNNDGV